MCFYGCGRKSGYSVAVISTASDATRATDSKAAMNGQAKVSWFENLYGKAQEMAEIFLNAMPVKLENDEIVLKETLIFEVTGFDEYSENLIKSSTIKV